MCKVQNASPNTKSTHESRRMGGEAAGVCGVWWELCEEVTEGWGIAIEIMMVGWIFEKEAGCKCRECCVGEESCPSGDEGSGSGMVQRCWSVYQILRKLLRNFPGHDRRQMFLTGTHGGAQLSDPRRCLQNKG